MVCFFLHILPTPENFETNLRCPNISLVNVSVDICKKQRLTFLKTIITPLLNFPKNHHHTSLKSILVIPYIIQYSSSIYISLIILQSLSLSPRSLSLPLSHKVHTLFSPVCCVVVQRLSAFCLVTSNPLASMTLFNMFFISYITCKVVLRTGDFCKLDLNVFDFCQKYAILSCISFGCYQLLMVIALSHNQHL